MSRRATFTIVVSSRIMSIPAQRIPRASQRDRTGARVSSVEVIVIWLPFLTVASRSLAADQNEAIGQVGHKQSVFGASCLGQSSLDQKLQAGEEGLTHITGDALDHLGLAVVDDRSDTLEQLFAVAGERDDPLAAICLGAGAAQQAPSLEVVDDGDHRGLVDLTALRQLALGEHTRPRFAQ